MTLQPGQDLLHYRLVEKIGEGGMGVVWKAFDTSLQREVAIKILPAEFSADQERLARFEREARLLASLNHANIASIHGLHATPGSPGSGEHAGTRFLAMELVGGADLAERVRLGPLPLEEALPLALQVAEALEVAHESGVIHRDLKPANIRVTDEGQVKVLDFGLAKAFAGDPSSSYTDPSLSPTMTSTGTLAGVILGTAAYMSSEQAKGKPVDKRADVWAFGCVLYEMLAGKRIFSGDTVSETLASVIKEEPAWDALPDDTPPRVRRLLRRCLEKDPRQRLRDIGDARIAVAEIVAGEIDEPAPSAATTSSKPVWLGALPWALTLILAALLVWAWTGEPQPERTGGAATRLSIPLPGNESVFMANYDLEVMPSVAISPAGDRVVYSAAEPDLSASRTAKQRNLRVRELGGAATEGVRGTEGGELPFFSPDGEWIGFFTSDTLSKVPASGGAPVTIAPLPGPGNGASWGRDGNIVFAHSYVGPLYVVPASGGEPRALTAPAEDERSHRYPQILPDGKSVLFTIKIAGILSFDDAKIGIANLETGEHRVLVDRGTYARYAGSGHVVYAREGDLLAAPFDLGRLELSGGTVAVQDRVVMNPITGAALMDIAENGTLVFAPGDYATSPTKLFAVERATGSRQVLLENRYISFPRLSPDGKRIVLHGSSANDQVWVLDLERETMTRVTDASTNNILPTWGPDGERVLFTTDRSGSDEIASMPARGGSAETLVAPVGVPQDACSWSGDGKRLAFNRGLRSSRDIWVLDLDRGAEPVPFVESSSNEGDPSFTPDGRWIAYASDESGQAEIYVSPYPGPGGKIQVSNGGGILPRWRGDAGELYFLTETALMSVSVTWNPAPRLGRSQMLFEVDARNPVGYDVTADGQLFYVAELDESRWRSTRLDVVLGWFGELERLAH